MIVRHDILWTTAAPLWPSSSDRESNGAGTGRAAFRRPAILRFAGDDFMDEFFATLQRDPARLRDLQAVPETWDRPANAGSVGTPPPAPEPVPKFIANLQRARAAASRSVRSRLSLSLSLRSNTVAKGSVLSRTSLSDAAPPLKLFQPAHQRFYLVTACLVCGLTGLPDRRPDSGRNERAAFVIRRLRRRDPDDTRPLTLDNGDESAFVANPAGGHGWQPVDPTNPATVLPGEEQHPLFAVNYVESDARSRRLFAGVVPVAKREAFLAAPALTAERATDPRQAPSPVAARTALLRSRVGEPWKNLINRTIAVTHTLVETHAFDDDPRSAATLAILRREREDVQKISWLVLLDLANFLKSYASTAWSAIQTGAATDALPPAVKTLVDGLRAPTLDDRGTKLTFAQALLDTVPFAAALDAVTAAYSEDAADPAPWPSFRFWLTDAEGTSERVITPPQPAAGSGSDEQDPGSSTPDDGNSRVKCLVDQLATIDNFVALVVQATLDPAAEPPPPEAPPPVAARKPLSAVDGTFVIRCVFERPNCGPLHPYVVSEATEPFKLAGFFDPDAPARPIRIGLPLDTTPAGLRKFDKNTAFVMSDILCGQMKRVRGVTLGDLVRTVLPRPIGKDLDIPDGGPCQDRDGKSLGMVCSLSLPIITICALIMLMIMVKLLDIVFRWMPFFAVCFPLPGLRGKRGEE